MTKKERINKVPRPNTIARHFAEGKLADLPADTVLSAVNSNDYTYNPTAIPIKISFPQLFAANFDAFAYLANHNSEEEVAEFLDDPTLFMERAGVKLAVPFDEFSPKIFASLVEDDILSLLRTEEGIDSIYELMLSGRLGWLNRHSERYPRQYMKLGGIFGLKDVPYLLEEETVMSHGFPEKLTMGMLMIYGFLKE